MLEICKYKVHYLNLTFCILPTCTHAYITVYRLANKKWPSQYVCYYLVVSLSLVNMYYSRLPVQAQPWQMLTGCSLATCCSGHRGGVCGVNREDRVVCVGVCRMRTFTDQQCWWDTNTNPSSWWNLPPTLAVPMVTHRIGTALQLTAYLNVLVYVCACELKDLRCALWSVHPCNPQAGFLGITNQPIRALTLSSLFLSLNPHTQKPYRIDGLF